MRRAGLYQPGHLWHALRHTYGAVLGAGGVRRHELEQLMGYVTPGTTCVYTHLFRENCESVHVVLDMAYTGERPGFRIVSRSGERRDGRATGVRPKAAARHARLPTEPAGSVDSDLLQTRNQMYIGRLETTAGHLRDTPLELSPRLNCIIGARGTCKSTIVETIRFLFNDDSARIEELLKPPDSDDSPSHRGLIRATLDGGTARLRLDGAEEPATLERDSSSQTRIYVDGVKAIDEPHLLTEVEIYSQGELQEIATSPPKRLELIDRPHKSEVQAWRESSAGLASRIASLGPQIRELRDVIEGSRVVLREGEALRRELAEVHASRPSMTPEMAEKRARFQFREQLQNRAAEVIVTYEENRAALAEAVAKLRTTAGAAAALAESEILGFEQLAGAIESSASRAEVMLTELVDPTELRSYAGRARSDFENEAAEYYEALKQEAAVTEAVKREDRLNAEVEKLERIELDVMNHEARLTQLVIERDEHRRTVQDLRTRVFSRRLSEVERINSEFSDNIVLALNHGTQTSAYRQKLDEMLAGSRLRDQAALCAQIAAALPPDKLVSLVDADDAEGMASILNRDEGQMLRLISHLSEASGLYHLEGEVADDELEITMFVEGVPKSVSEMSKGQKATAILPLLLRPASYPLVLDQPEDDLDNRFIFETLIQKIEALKLDRQLIFVTHNANIPVIGDAERVFVMSMDGPSHAQLVGVGTVDEMRDEILLLLEGGREAFELRSRTYGLPERSGK